MPSLCFIASFRAKQKGDISEEEYIHNIFLHCQGVEHDEDENRLLDWELENTDLFGYSVRCWSRRIEQVKDIIPFENVFKAYRTGDVEDVKLQLGKLNSEHANYIRKSLAMLALLDRRAAVLKLCLDQGGFAHEHYFEDEANEMQDANDDPETFKVLEESDFRRTYPRPASRAEGANEEGSEQDENPAAVFDQGGRLPVDW